MTILAIAPVCNVHLDSAECNFGGKLLSLEGGREPQRKFTSLLLELVLQLGLMEIKLSRLWINFPSPYGW